MVEMKTVNLGEIISFKNGKKRPSEEGHIPVYGGNGILGYTSANNYNNCIAIGRVGAYCGSVYYEPQKCWISDNAIAALPNEDIDIYYAYYLLKSLNLNHRHIGTSQPLLTQEILNKIECRITSNRVQKKISNILRLVDSKITTNGAINRNLQEMMCAVYEQRFSSLDKVRTLEEYPVRIYSGGTPSTAKKEYWNGNIPWLASGETAQSFVIETEKHITQEGVDNSSTKWANKYDVVTASAGQGHTRGQTSMLLLDTCVNQSVIVTHAEKQYMPFIYCNIYGRYEELRVLSDGTSTRGSLTTKIMAKLSMPDVAEQDIIEFADFAWPIIDKIEKSQREICRLTMLRDALLPKLMSGELDVSDLDI